MINSPYSPLVWQPVKIGRGFWHHRLLIWQLTRREIISRYKGSVLGITWSFMTPLIMLAVYTFVFTFVFKTRWDFVNDNRPAFALALYMGLILHSILAECLNRAPTLILSNVNYVKKVVFPLEILVLVMMGSILFHALVGMLVWSCFYVGAFFKFHWTAVFFPLLWLPLILFGLGFSWFLAAVGVFFRDLSHMIHVVSLLLLFLAPIFYPLSALPEAMHKYFYLNPLTLIVVESRKVLMLDQTPDWSAWLISLTASILVAWLGYIWFQKVKRGFADVL